MRYALLSPTVFRLARRSSALVLVVLLTVSASAHAQWKWRDKDGRVTVSDRPPPKDVADKDILSKPASARRAALASNAPASAASAAAGTASEAQKSPLEREVEARRKAMEQEQATKAKADEARLAGQRAENCQRARSHLGALESGQRIARVNDKGEREIVDDKGRADEIRQAREVIASECR